MWKPPERIKHYPDPGKWPSADQAGWSIIVPTRKNW